MFRRLFGYATWSMPVVVIVLFVLSVRWTGGVYGRSGDVLLGILPGQFRIGWSEDVLNRTNWLTIDVQRTGNPIRWSDVMGGQTFTTAAPLEVAVDCAMWPAFVLFTLWAVVWSIVARRWREDGPRTTT